MILTQEETEQINHFTEEEVLKLYSRFKAFDESGDGLIAIDDVVKAKPELRENPLLQRVFSVLDKDGDGKVSFVEFVSGLARIAADEATKLEFLFDLYDLDKDGFVSNADLFTVVKMMAADNLSDLQLQQLVDRTMRDFDIDLDKRLSFEEFKAAVKSAALTRQLGVDLS